MFVTILGTKTAWITKGTINTNRVRKKDETKEMKKIQIMYGRTNKTFNLQIQTVRAMLINVR